MSAIATAYVRRHVAWQVNRTKSTLMSHFADVADDKGRTVQYTQKDATHDMGCSLITVKRAMAGLMRPPPGAPGPFLKKIPGSGYQILGMDTHDQRTCGVDECLGEAEDRQAAGGKLSEKKRRQAAARMRKMRRKRREEAQGTETA